MRALHAGTIAVIIAAPRIADAGPHHHRCRDPERVLGHRTCGRFGDWSYVTRLPPITLGWTVQARALASQPPNTRTDGTLAREREPGATDALTAFGPGVRITVGVWPGLYVGGEMSGGVADAWRGGYGALAAIAGGQGRIDRTSFAIELAAGALFADSATRSNGWRADLDLRVRFDRWVSPWWTIGGFAGLDPFVRDYTAGAQFAFRFRAYDGGR